MHLFTLEFMLSFEKISPIIAKSGQSLKVKDLISVKTLLMTINLSINEKYISRSLYSSSFSFFLIINSMKKSSKVNFVQPELSMKSENSDN